ncbi:MAG: VOC family protein [Woeseia sp.]
MISGAHSIIFSTDPVADRAFLRDVFGFPHVDAGDGWLIFGLPPAELAVHPSERNDAYGFHLICDDIDELIAKLKDRDLACSGVEEMPWGMLTNVRLPGGGTLGIYQPKHERPAPAGASDGASII